MKILKAHELIEILKGFDASMPVAFSLDGSGDVACPVESVSIDVFGLSDDAFVRQGSAGSESVDETEFRSVVLIT